MRTLSPSLISIVLAGSLAACGTPDKDTDGDTDSGATDTNDTTSTGDTRDTGDSGDTGTVSDSGDSGDSGGDTGDSGDSGGDSGDSGDSGGDTGDSGGGDSGVGDSGDTDIPLDTFMEGDTDFTVPDDLMITEVVDDIPPPNGKPRRWIEIWNPGTTRVSTALWSIVYRESGTGEAQRINLKQVTQRDSIAKGDVLVVAYDQGYNEALYGRTYGEKADGTSSKVRGDGDDPYTLEYRRRVVDVYGELGTPASLSSWSYGDQRAQRKSTVSASKASFDASQWERIAMNDSPPQPTTLGYHITQVIDTAEDTDIDTSPPDDSFESSNGLDTFDTDPVDTDTDLPPDGVDTLTPGDLVITEIMVSPTDCADERGEYLAVRSLVPRKIDLKGLTLSNGTQNTTLADSLEVSPGGEAVLWLDPVSSDFCYWIDGFGASYTGVRLNEGGSIAIGNGSGTLDTVDFSTWTIPQGAALTFDSAFLSPDDYDAELENDNPERWCSTGNPLGAGLLDTGSPGESNDVCPVEDTDTHSGDSVVDSVVDSTPIDTGVLATPVSSLGSGDLVISEIMVNPGTACLDENGEYIEVYNPGLVKVDLTGMQVKSKSGTATVQASSSNGKAVIKPSSFAVLYRTPTATQCFGMVSPLTYTAYAYSNEVLFDDAGDSVEILNGSGRIDLVDFSGWAQPSYMGDAWSLDRDEVTAVLNDDEAAWCHNGPGLEGPAGPGNLGTPGQILSCAP